MLEYCEVAQHKQSFYRSPNPVVRLLLCLIGAPRPFLKPWSNIISQAASPPVEKTRIAKAVTDTSCPDLKKRRKKIYIYDAKPNQGWSTGINSGKCSPEWTEAKFVTASDACLPLHSMGKASTPLLPMLSDCSPFAAALCLGSCVCLHLCFSVCISLVSVILSFGYHIQVSAKHRGSPSSVSLGDMGSLRLQPTR